MFLQETFAIEDCEKYISSGSVSSTSAIYTLSSHHNVEISATVTFNGKGAFTFAENVDSAYSQIDICDINYNPPKFIEVLDANSFITQIAGSWSYPADVKFRYENGVATVWIDGVQEVQASVNIQPIHIGWRSFGGTLTYSNLKIKPL